MGKGTTAVSPRNGGGCRSGTLSPRFFPVSQRIHLAVPVFYPIEVKRQLATVKGRAVPLARQVIPARLVDPSGLDALECTAEVIPCDLGPCWDVRQTLAGGANVWLLEVE